jgi:hypothetical protein
MSPTPKPDPDSAIWRKLVLPVEDKRLYPSATPWAGGFRWFRSANVIDLQHYRSETEKQRIRAMLAAQSA